MIPMKRVGLLAGAATLTLTGGSFADTDLEAQNEELRGRISELESRLVAVESQSSDSWLTEQRADEVRALVQDVLADADTRSSLLSQGMTAGYDDGAVIASADGNWLLRTNIHMQQRYVINVGSNTYWDQNDDGVKDATEPSLDDDRWGFENTRTKFILSGNVVSPEWFYLVDINVGSAQQQSSYWLRIVDTNGDGVVDSGDSPIEVDEISREGVGNAYLGYDYGNGWKVMMGSMKTPLLREELVDARYQLAMERSLVNYLFTGGYTDGIALDYMSDQFHVTAMYNDGANQGQTLWSNADTDFAFTVRGEWLAMGTWEQFTDLTSPPGEEQGLMIGGAIHYETAEDDDPMVLDIDQTILTGDVSWEFGGGNIFAAVMYNSLDYPSGASDADQMGFVVQGGYYLNDTWELYGRYEYADLDTKDIDDVNILSVGINKYFADHHAKWTTELGFAMDGILGHDEAAGGFDGNTGAFPLAGWRADPDGDDGQVTIKTQIQIVF
ncbi:MAG: porin [Planctomycetota bacterium]